MLLLGNGKQIGGRVFRHIVVIDASDNKSSSQ